MSSACRYARSAAQDYQRDFTWLAPHETKTFTQYFLPYKGVGNVKNVNLKAALNFEIDSTNELLATLR